MQEKSPLQDPTPADCFKQSELEMFQSFEIQVLHTVNYYRWRSETEYAFLFALELYFENGETLLLSSGESSDAIRIIPAQSLVDTARKLQEMHGKTVIQRLIANTQPLWQGAVGVILQGIQLSRHEGGLYRNDALLFDFGAHKIAVQLSQKDGLELLEH